MRDFVDVLSEAIEFFQLLMVDFDYMPGILHSRELVSRHFGKHQPSSELVVRYVALVPVTGWELR